MMRQKEPLHILLAEDNAVNRMVAVQYLEKLGLKVDVVEDGKQVLEALDIRNYDIIFMDVLMPNMDGIEATRLIRKREAEDEQPYIIAVTASALSKEREKCFQAGMDDYITKPIILEKVQNSINTYYEKKSKKS